MTPDQIKDLVDQIAVPFYRDWAFWIGNAIGLLGLLFSIGAYFEARQAKREAIKAGQVAKIETVKIELADIAQTLEKIPADLDFQAANILFNSVNRRLRRLIGHYRKDRRFSQACQVLKGSLDDARVKLDEVKPSGPDLAAASEIPSKLVYLVMVRPFGTISGHVSEMLGLFESATIESTNE